MSNFKLQEGDEVEVAGTKFKVIDGDIIEVDERSPIEKRLDDLEGRVATLENKGWYYPYPSTGPWTWSTEYPDQPVINVPDPPGWPNPSYPGTSDPNPGTTWTSCEDNMTPLDQDISSY
jgi:hypothetical protein